jgi:RNA polymerase sigma factor (sigma-70 family)
MSASVKTAREMQGPLQDEFLVKECLSGNEDAWSALIDKYKNLIFSIPIKRGFSSEDAADIFQAVCLALVSELPRLRQSRALPAWLIQTTSRKCFRWQNSIQRYSNTELQKEMQSDEAAKVPEELVAQIEREQIVRDTVSELPTNCKRLIELLFYHSATLSYDDLAAALGIPKGSIGPIRMRCFEKLRRLLDEKGF